MAKDPPDDDRNLPAPLTYGGKVIHDRDALVSLTDMWRAAGSPKDRRPSDWLSLNGTAEFVSAVEASFNAGQDGIIRGERGRGKGTWGHWQIGLAYAKYLSVEFHMWANTVVRNRMEEMRALPRISAADVDVTDPAIIHRVVQYLQKQVEQGRNDATALRRIERSKGSFCITDAAKMLKMRRSELWDWLVANRWIYQRPGTDKWAVYSDKQQALLLESVPFYYPGRDGTERVKMQINVTTKGLVRLAHLLGRQLDQGGLDDD